MHGRGPHIGMNVRWWGPLMGSSRRLFTTHCYKHLCSSCCLLMVGKGTCTCLVLNYEIMLLFSLYVMSNSLWPHGLQQARLFCPLSPGVCSNSCPLSRWCHPTISSSVIPFSSCPQSFPVSWSFPVSQFFTSGGQSIGVSASASVLPVNIQDWFPVGLTGLISLSPRVPTGLYSTTSSLTEAWTQLQWSNTDRTPDSTLGFHFGTHLLISKF